jgi:hypothetical protein
MPPEARAWRYSELGEMAERLGDDQAAEHWFREGLQLAPEDFYMRAACADLLLRQRRAAETLQLLAGYESMEPMLLRIAIAQQLLGQGGSAPGRAMLAARLMSSSSAARRCIAANRRASCSISSSSRPGAGRGAGELAGPARA